MNRLVLLFAPLLCACVTDPGHLHDGVNRSLVELAHRVAPDAGAVILFDRSYVQHDVLGGYAITAYEHERAVLINSEAGLAEAAIDIPYPEKVTFVALSADIDLPDGRRIELSNTEIFDHEISRSAGAEPLVSRARSFAFPEVTPGAVLSYRYVLNFDGYTTDLHEAVAPDLPVLEARHEACLSDSLVFLVDQSGFDLLKHDHEGDCVHYVWVLSKPHLIPPPEPFAELPGRRTPWIWGDVTDRALVVDRLGFDRVRVVLGKGRDWKSVGRAIASWIEDDSDDPLPRLTTTSTAIETRVAAAYHFVQDSVALRASLKPAQHDHVDAILRRGYGTSKEATRVLRALLRRERGLSVSLVFAPKEDMPDPNPKAPSFEVIGGIPMLLVEHGDRSWWLDVGCHNCAAGQYRSEAQGRWALVVHPRPDQIEMVQIPWQWTPAAETSVELELAVSGRRLVARRCKLEARGMRATSLRNRAHAMGDPAGIDHLVKDWFGLEPEPGKATIRNLDDRDRVLHAEVEGGIIADTELVSTPDRLWLSLADTVPLGHLEGLGPTRHTPLRFERPPSLRLVLTVEAPEGLHPKVWPRAQSIETRFGGYRLEVTPHETGIALSETLEIRAPEITVAEYPELRAFVAQILAARRAPLGFGR